MNLSLRTTRKFPALVVGLALGAITAGSVAYAAIPSADGTIKGCYANSSSTDAAPKKGGGSVTAYTKGDVRIVDADEACRSYETAISWNQKGEKGETGDSGPAGPQGLQGVSGPVGPQGPQGETGSVGPQGPAGTAGQQGATGPAGPQGETGAAGATGPAGPQGEQGPAGADGVAPIFYNSYGPRADVAPAGQEGADLNVLATCESGDTVLAGGYEIDEVEANSAKALIAVTHDGPSVIVSDSGVITQRWKVAISNLSLESVRIQVWVSCVKQPTS